MRINLKKLKQRCNAKIEDFYHLGKVVESKNGDYIYIDRGMPVLAVAHLDTVNNSYHFNHIVLNGVDVVFSTALDDRLGAYIILDELPKYIGNNYDILLTEGEETGNSTAAFFEPSHDYNWMFQFDRAGDDVVLYQYDTPENRKLLRNFGFRPNWGSFSDICFLDHLAVSGFNFGCGYEDNHSNYSHFEVHIAEKMIAKFIPFFKAMQNVYIPAPPKVNYYKNYKKYDDNNWVQNDKGYWEKKKTVNPYTNSYISRSYEVGDCVNCNAYNVDVNEEGLCPKCALAYEKAMDKIKFDTGLREDLCLICQNYTLVDSNGYCAECSKWE